MCFSRLLAFAACARKEFSNFLLPVYFDREILMARFALDLSEQGKGYGKVLFRDALRRALAGAEAIGGRAFLVHAKDEEARAFYAHYGMEALPTNPLHLFLLFKDIRKSLDAAEQKKS
jgi:GNAT superfamily N-acetyltransferase